MKKTKSSLKRPNYSIHKLSTDLKDLNSVVTKDSFFVDFEVCDRINDFLLEISLDKTISAFDIAKLVLSIQPISNLKLQKTIYLIYADFLVKTGKRLFEDKIIASQYGLVIQTIYDHYKKHGCEPIEEISDSQVVILDETTIPVILAKILKSDDEEAILESVKVTFVKFGDQTVSQLVLVTQ